MARNNLGIIGLGVVRELERKLPQELQKQYEGELLIHKKKSTYSRAQCQSQGL